jgi:hypothetical protein
MNGIAAEVAQEVLVLFENENVDAGARQQHSEHHARWPAAGYATGDMLLIHAAHSSRGR